MIRPFVPARTIGRHSVSIAALSAALTLGLAMAMPSQSTAAPVQRTALGKPTETMTLSIGSGQMIRLPENMTDLFVADNKIADVQVRSSNQLYVFGKGAGETSIYATNKAGAVVWSSTVRVGNNITSVDTMLKLAMPEATITATTMNGMVLLTGTVASPADVEEAQHIVETFVGKETQVISRLKTATPMQVNLQVKIAEVSREFAKSIGVNLLSRDTTSGFLFGLAQGRSFGSIKNLDTSALPQLDASSLYGLPSGSLKLPFDPTSGQFVTGGTTYALDGLLNSGSTSLGFAGKFAGLDLIAALDLAESDGLVSTLAQPNLTALSGETASFLAGGEIPIPLSTGLGNVTVEFKQYGVSLAFTPTVLADGRISLRVRPEVSQLSSAGAVKLNGFTIPGLTTRRAETTIELGSGQAFMIGGLMTNGQNNTIDKAPFLGDLPILGSLFRSTGFKRNETELMIVVTPYLVRPTSPDKIQLPTDGYKAATDAERILAGQSFSGRSGTKRPVPTSLPPKSATPGLAPDATPKGAAAPASRRKTAAASPTPPASPSVPDAGFGLE